MFSFIGWLSEIWKIAHAPLSLLPKGTPVWESLPKVKELFLL